MRPYEDTVGEDGLLRYKWRGSNAADGAARVLNGWMYSAIKFRAVRKSTAQTFTPAVDTTHPHLPDSAL